MSYDPELDPRSLPYTEELPAQERDRLEGTLEGMENQIRAMDEALLMYAHPGWQQVKSLFEGTVEELERVLSKEQDQSMWKFYRGQYAQVLEFIALPERLAQRQLQLRRDHARLMRELGKE